jgi:pinin
LEDSSNLGIGICQAEQKAQEESERLRQQEREQLAERRKNDLV